MKIKLFVLATVLFLNGCQLTPKNDYTESYELTNPLEVTVMISNKVPIDTFKKSVYKALGQPYEDMTIYSQQYESKYKSYWFHDLSTGDSFNVANYQIPITASFSTDKKYHTFHLKTTENKINGYGFGFTDPSSKMKQFKFEQVESAILRNMHKLQYITSTSRHIEVYDGKVTLKNDDVTAFANIQRFFANSFLSTNTKTDSEKSGTFTPYSDTEFNFHLYPYKSVSKMEYRFTQTYDRTHHAFTPDMKHKGLITTTKNKNFEQEMLSSALKAFND